MRRRSLVALVCSGLTMAAGAGSAAAATVADNGFRPDPDGFSFENYGNDSGYQNLTSVEMQRLFGRAVCADSAGTPAGADPAHSQQTAFAGAGDPSPCNLTPPAQQWMNAQNKEMNGGHCQGFAVLAERLFKDQFPRFGTGPTFSYKIAGNLPLQHAIAYAFVSQVLDSVVAARIKGTPNDILNRLKTALTPSNKETYTLGIYKSDGSGGHAITPFAVQDLGGGKFAVDVYDNNYPNETRQVMFDTAANTWTYNAAINPSVTPEVYSGSASNPAIELDPTTPGEGVQPCPFCGSAQAAADASAKRLDTIQLLGSLHAHAHLVIADGAGHQAGVINGQIVNTFPGAQVQPMLQFTDYSDTSEPAYLIPSRNVTITVDGSHLDHNDTETLSDVGPGQDLAIQNLKIGVGQKDVLKLSHGLEHLAFTLAKGRSSGSPVIHLGADSSKADVALTLTLVRAKPGSTIHVKLNPARQLITFYSTGNRGAATFKLSAVKETRRAKIVEATDTVTLRGHRSITYSYAK